MPRGTFTIVVDDSLAFEFEASWLAVKWDTTPWHVAGSGKDTDLVAAGKRALLVEVKDDRVHGASPVRAKPRKQSEFIPEVAQKFAATLKEVLAAADRGDGGPTGLPVTFAKKWRASRHRVVLWWERGPNPPQGPGTPDARWRVHFSAVANKLKEQLHGIARTVEVMSSVTSTGPDDGVVVRSRPDGVGTRVASLERGRRAIK